MSEEESKIIDKVMAIFEGKLGIDKSKYKDSSVLSDLGLDSLDVVEVLLDIEKELNIKFTGDDKPKTIKDLKDLILVKTSKK